MPRKKKAAPVDIITDETKDLVAEINKQDESLSVDRWDNNGGAIAEQPEEFVPEIFIPYMPIPTEGLNQVTTKYNAKIYDAADLSSQKIHISMPSDFVVYAVQVRERHKRTMFWQISEGELTDKFIDVNDVESFIKLNS